MCICVYLYVYLYTYMSTVGKVGLCNLADRETLGKQDQLERQLHNYMCVADINNTSHPEKDDAGVEADLF